MDGDIDQSIASSNDRSFHYKIASASRNPLIITMLNAISYLIENQINKVRLEMLSDKKNIERINLQHRQILESLKRRDSKLVIEAMNQHMNFIEEFIHPTN